MPLSLYGPFLYQNFWIIIITNIHILDPNYFRNLHDILIRHFPEYR